MRVAFFNRSFYPDAAATGQLLTELCEGLVRDHGYEVTVVAGLPLIVSGRTTGNGTRGLVSRESHAGIEILRARGTRFPKSRITGRISNYASYWLSACYAGLRLQRPQVVCALTDPPIIGLVAYFAARRFGVPFVMSYRDIFPEVTALLEDFHSDAINRALLGVNRFLCRKADCVIALGETMRKRLIEGKGADPAKTVIIPDWADCKAIVPTSKSNPFSEAHGLADKFVVMHSGNLGLSQNLETLVEAAAQLQDLPELVMVFVGEGVKKPVLQQMVAERQIGNIRFLPYQPKSELLNSFGTADCFVVSLRRGLSGYIVPSKLYGILAAGRPYIAALEEDSEAVLIAQRDGCGLWAPPADAGALAAQIRTLYLDRPRAQQMGLRAREAGLRFDRRVGVAAYNELFTKLVAGPSLAPSPSLASSRSS